MTTTEDHFHQRILHAEKKAKRLYANPAPTMPIYDITVKVKTN